MHRTLRFMTAASVVAASFIRCARVANADVPPPEPVGKRVDAAPAEPVKKKKKKPAPRPPHVGFAVGTHMERTPEEMEGTSAPAPRGREPMPPAEGKRAPSTDAEPVGESPTVGTHRSVDPVRPHKIGKKRTESEYPPPAVEPPGVTVGHERVSPAPGRSPATKPSDKPKTYGDAPSP